MASAEQKLKRGRKHCDPFVETTFDAATHRFIKKPRTKVLDQHEARRVGGQCTRCKELKKKCDNQVPCSQCQKVALSQKPGSKWYGKQCSRLDLRVQCSEPSEASMLSPEVHSMLANDTSRAGPIDKLETESDSITPQVLQGSVNGIPKQQATCGTVSNERLASYIDALPCSQYNENCNRVYYMEKVSRICQSLQNLFKNDDELMQSFKSLLPDVTKERYYKDDFPRPGKRPDVLSYMKLLVFITSNNMQYSHGFENQMLERIEWDSIWKDWFEPPLFFVGHYQGVQGLTMRVIAQSAFRHFIKTDDAERTKHFLQDSYLGIKVDEEFILIDNEKMTPIECSSFCNFVPLTKVLLDHDADVNKSWADGWKQGALNRAVTRLQRPDTELVRILIDAGATVQTEAILLSIRRRHADAAELMIRAYAKSDHEEWSAKGLFRDAVDYLDAETTSKVIEVMISVGADINHRVQSDQLGSSNPSQPQHHLQTMLDVAAHKGDLDLVDQLLESGAILTCDTLSSAIRSKSATLVTFLLHMGAEVESITSFGSSPFAEAVRAKNAGLRQDLSRQGALRRIKERDHIKAIMEAASEAGDFDLVSNMLNIEADLSQQARASYGLQAAIEADHTEISVFLVDTGAEINDKLLGFALDKRNTTVVQALLEAGIIFKQEPVILKAIEQKDYALVLDLIAAGADINQSPDTLHVAAEHSRTAAVKLLLDAGDNDTTGLALCYAVCCKEFDMIAALFEYGIDPCNSSALEAAVEVSPEIIDTLFSEFERRNLNGKRTYNSEPLIKAIELGQLQLMEKVWPKTVFNHLSHNLDPDCWDELDEKVFDFTAVTPLAVAILKDSGKSLKEARWLLEHGISANSLVSASPQLTALSMAVVSQSIQMVQLLLEFGADVNHPASRGIARTALQQAAESGSVVVAEHLLNRGAEVNAAPSRSGGTALQLAAKKGYLGTTVLLLRAGADINAPPAKVDGRTALESAAEWGRLDTVSLLLQAGAKIDGDYHRYFKSAIRLAEGNAHFAVADLLKSYSPPDPPGFTGVATNSQIFEGIGGVETEEGFEPLEKRAPRPMSKLPRKKWDSGPQGRRAEVW